MTDDQSVVSSFSDFNLPPSLMAALSAVGYETPSPIQAQTIPPLMEGKDVLGHAPTGTGKTAAFALPLLSRIDVSLAAVQLLVLTPTRELAIQVAEALQRYASKIEGFRVLPVYGGQEYGGQIRQLSRGVHVVVGTPGRLMDHMRKGTLKLDRLQAMVLDEADEMLRMGFIDDVEWILEQLPEERQLALFSATMPQAIGRIARKYLRDPVDISIKSKTATAEKIRQRYWLVSNLHKLDALTRILEVEPFDAMLIFVRTRTATVELADRLQARGHAASALNGDMPQAQREQMITQLKNKKLDLLVATDVAARGLDVDRISHVVNYDIPHDTEAYIHRIGRTGRAGREGDAILFVQPRERRLLAAIERATRSKIEVMDLPTTEMVNNHRIARFMQGITDTREAGELEFLQGLLEKYQLEHDAEPMEIAAALAHQMLGDKSLLMEEKPHTEAPRRESDSRPRREPSDRGERKTRAPGAKSKGPVRPPKGMERYRIEVGHDHDVKPSNIVGALANEAGLDAQNIGHIDILDDHSHVDLPIGMPKDILADLKKTWICGRRIAISRLKDGREGEATTAPKRTVRANVGTERVGASEVPFKEAKRAKEKRPAKSKRSANTEQAPQHELTPKGASPDQASGKPKADRPVKPSRLRRRKAREHLFGGGADPGGDAPASDTPGVAVVKAGATKPASGKKPAASD